MKYTNSYDMRRAMQAQARVGGISALTADILGRIEVSLEIAAGRVHPQKAEGRKISLIQGRQTLDQNKKLLVAKLGAENYAKLLKMFDTYDEHFAWQMKMEAEAALRQHHLDTEAQPLINIISDLRSK